ncbi:MAG TPA: tRNA (adenosine(37)-N6)-threonylcarbamoyltransferase complex ATPase subunit type 1 TsaE [Acidimicrobiia bacterium]|nr:tRNA (adenosine(37)-N6)-threonylcarbamoyltransferase complex ATPase subunit type 1 TsaE [Acidimicrobiia bacterium]
MTVELSSGSEVETRAIGRRLASFLCPGDVVLLAGELGAGKTAFAGGLAEGLGIEEPVISPSFMLVRRYADGFIPLTHADVYRLGSLNELEDLDVLEGSRDGVLIVEWGNAVAAAMPHDHLRVEFEVMGPNERVVRLVPHGAWRDRSLKEMLE